MRVAHLNEPAAIAVSVAAVHAIATYYVKWLCISLLEVIGWFFFSSISLYILCEFHNHAAIVGWNNHMSVVRFNRMSG